MKNKIEELKTWLITEKANAMQYCRDGRKNNDFNAALIGGTSATAFASTIKKVDEIFESECSSVAEVKEKSFRCLDEAHKMKCVTQCVKCKVIFGTE